MVRGIQSISIPTVDYSMAQGSKMSLPVDTTSLIYSHFEHVSGIPAPKGTQGVSISKLHILDVLIGQINQFKNNNNVTYTSSALPENGIDYLIASYKTQIRQAKDAGAAMPYLPTPSAQAGALFSLIT